MDYKYNSGYSPTSSCSEYATSIHKKVERNQQPDEFRSSPGTPKDGKPDDETDRGKENAARLRNEFAAVQPDKQRKKSQAQKAQGKPAPKVEVVEVKPIAESAAMKRRHWGLMLSFVLAVLIPLVLAGAYLWGVAKDQYASMTGFTVRQEEGGSASEILGGIAEFAGAGSASGDTDVLYEFMQSTGLVSRIDDELQIREHYSQYWPEDPVFALWPDASIEELLSYWSRTVRISYDQSNGLIELRVLAYTPEKAQEISQEIVSDSQELINELNAQARSDTIQYAQNDLQEAQTRLKEAREALTKFRTRTQIVDPESDIQGRMGVLNNLQQQLAQALIEYDLLAEGRGAGDPRSTQALRRIEVIRERIAQERSNFTSNSVGLSGEDYPSLMAEYESLSVDREFAEQNYRAALTALSSARSNATRQTRYLATYQQPTKPESALYPRRWTLFALTALFLTLAWAILALVYYSIRDRS